MIQPAVLSAREDAIDSNIVPHTTSPSPDGYPLLWAVTWRTRSAAWMLDQRAMLQTVIKDASLGERRFEISLGTLPFRISSLWAEPD